MSLVSAIPEKNAKRKQEVTPTSSRTSTLTSTSSKTCRRPGSVYQTSGEPLSKEALYRAKMKYGMYQSPAKNYPLGVSDVRVASDAAATRANSVDLTVEEFKRYLDPDATRAASSVSRKNKENVIPDEAPKVAGRRMRANSAASKAYSLASTNSGTSSIIGGKTPKQKNKELEKLHDNSSAHIKPNMSKIINGAEKKAGTRVQQRWQPERKNYSYGLKTDAAENNQFNFTSNVMGNIMAKTETEARRKNVDRERQEIQEKAKKDAAFALGAAFAVKDMDPTTIVDEELLTKEQEKKIYLKQLTSQQVLARARANVDKEIQALEEQNYEQRLFGNEEYNRAAVAVAKANYTNNKSQYSNMINLGGGLWLKPEEIEKISHDMLNPVLNEINKKADDQRAADIEIAEKTKFYSQDLSNWNRLNSEKVKNDEQYTVDAKKNFQTQKAKAVEEATEKYDAMIKAMEKQVADENKELEKAKQAYEDLKEETRMKLALEQERADKELENWGKYRENDLKDALKEQEILLQPYVDDLKSAEKEEKRLIGEYDGINEEIVRLRTGIESHKKKIANYESDLAGQENREERENILQDELEKNKADLELELNDNIIVLANKAKEEAALAAKEARLKQLEVEAVLNKRKTDLNKTEIELQKEKLNLLDVMKEVAELSGDNKLDEERVKNLIGETPDDFIAKVNSKEREFTQSAISIDDGTSSTKEGASVPDQEVPADKITEDPSATVNSNLQKSAAEGKREKEVSLSEPVVTSGHVEKVDQLTVPGQKDNEKNESGSENELNPTFSGFSQGSIRNDNDEEDDITNTVEDADDANKNQGYFKEVF
ncbi:hypothetical protein KAFR_0A02280 [Kazachstania africana CBS 2517]|uniref:Eisosome protein 1 n=1 Tax=Kazachstania africana (strain ATCC 22294 / BCRC 22015 / CBS 2517 / CECT 1963 / NBRC 1671 / NRRL Y-8276) TaxID=1071382 RepID=H2AMR6_KAZAF|nr:hypothetical protein KAFR_0A02280 [Kazachstania africana CBS 2517]CCF55666.1 hypothetical protein KAFR_0A02280 [Kazachstania africana CBS 2517]